MKSKWQNVFDGIRSGEATTMYCIVFTPRSGSTWLGDVLTRSKMLGIPKEWFNTEAAGETIRQSGCRDINQYYEYLKCVKTTQQVFGMEITWPQHRGVVEESRSDYFLSDIPHWFYLRRRDYVAQGVSLFKAINSGVFHSVQTGKQAREVVYDGAEIENLVNRIMRQEYAWKGYFEGLDRTPHPLWYEDIVQTPPSRLVRDFAGKIDIDIAENDPDTANITPALKKIGDTDSENMCLRFREDYANRISYWDEHRGTRSK